MRSPRRTTAKPLCIVIAGPNGAGKTTFARDFLPRESGVIRFVNADLIAMAWRAPANASHSRAR
jgi:predicted ABC-type ATPase